MDDQTYESLKTEIYSLYDAEMIEWTHALLYEKIKLVLKGYFNVQRTQLLYAEHQQLISYQNHHGLPFSIIDSFIKEEDFEPKMQWLYEMYEHQYDDVLAYREGEQVLVVILLQSTEQWIAFKKEERYQEFSRMFFQACRFITKLMKMQNRETNYRKLYEVTKAFNATMESKEILDLVMRTIKERFPNMRVDLLLSHEQKEHVTSYRLFDYLNERQLTIEAFLSGEMTIDEGRLPTRVVRNVPIKGKQGIYGILQICSSKSYVYSELEIEFIQMVAQSAGNALENASLYNQSSNLIDDLQLVNETSKRLNDNLGLREMIVFLKNQLVRAFHPTEYAFVFFEEGLLHILKESSPYFASERGERYLYQIGQRVIETNDAIFDADFDIDSSKVPEFQSLIAAPVISRGQVQGFVILLHQEKYAFSFEDFKLVRSLISHASLALSNILLREQLQELVDKDSLTKLYSRRYADKVIAQSLKYDECGVLLILDIDDFKKINDTHGHAIGDQVLVQAAKIVKSIVGEYGIASRWGGEEITVLLPAIDLSNGLKFADQILEQIPIKTTPKVTVSMGVMYWSKANQYTYKELFIFTDEALYEAKGTGKNKYVIYKPLQSDG